MPRQVLSFREFLGDNPGIHSAGVERHPDNGGRHSAVRERAKIAEAAKSPRSEDWKFRDLDNVFHQWQVSSLHCLLTVDCRYQNSGQWKSIEFLYQVEDELWMSSCPAVRQNFAIANVSGYDNRSRKKAGHFDEPVRIFKRSGADDHVLRAVIQSALYELAASDSAADLDLDICVAQYRLDLGSVVAVACYSVEIDDVEMSKAILPPGEGDPERIGDTKYFPVIRAGSQLDTRPSAQV
jgi:hypothetical protein